MLHVTIIGARDVSGIPPSSNVIKSDMSRQGTGGGSVMPAQATPSPARNPALKSSPDLGSSNVDPFVEMKIGREIHRTPFVHSNAKNPMWNWKFDCALAGDVPLSNSELKSAVSTPAPRHPPSSTSRDGPSYQAATMVLKDDMLRFFVLNAMTIGEPERLCSCQVSFVTDRNCNISP